MRVLPLALVILMSACGQSNAGKKTKPAEKNGSPDTVSQQQPTTSASYTLPGAELVNQSLASRFNNLWNVLSDDKASWMKDAFDYFIVPKRKTDPDYPYITYGDYNADGKPDTAAVVVDSLKSKYQVAVLMGDGKTIFWKEDIMADAALSTITKSNIDGMDGERTKKVKMKGDGINVEYFERAAFVLYWDKNGFKRIQTAD